MGITEEKPCPETYCSEIGYKILTSMKDAIESLLKDIDERETIFTEYFQTPFKGLSVITSTFNPWKKSDLAYSIHKFLEENKPLKTIAFSGGREIPISYIRIQITRNEALTLPSYCNFFMERDGDPYVLFVNLEEKFPFFNIYSRKENLDKASKIHDDILVMIRTQKFWKGEKIKFKNRSFEFLSYPMKRMDELILKQDIKEEINRNLHFIIRNKDLFLKNKLPWRRGVLLEGVPGTGKTLLAKVLCNEMKDITMIQVSTESIDYREDVALLFEAARDLAPSIVYFEDIDLLAPEREMENSEYLGELLNQLDGIEDNEGIFVIASTNRPHLLDKALTNRPSRFDVKIKFDLPENKERFALVKLYGSDLDYTLQKIIADASTGFTPAQIQETIIYSKIISLEKKKVIDNLCVEESLKKTRKNVIPNVV